MIEKSKKQGSRTFKVALLLLSMMFIIPLFYASPYVYIPIQKINCYAGAGCTNISYMNDSNFNSFGIAVNMSKNSSINFSINLAQYPKLISYNKEGSNVLIYSYNQNVNTDKIKTYAIRAGSYGWYESDETIYSTGLGYTNIPLYDGSFGGMEGIIYDAFINSTVNFSTYNSGVSYPYWITDILSNFDLYEVGLNLSINLYDNSQIFNSIAYETTTESLIINLTYDNIVYTGISANLIYNGTSYAGTKIGTGSNILFTRSLSIPAVSNTLNNTFYWRIALTNSSGTSYYNSTFNNQTVKNTGFDDCSAYNNRIINISLFDEEFKTYVSSSGASIEVDLTYSNPTNPSLYLTYHNNFTNRNNLSICMENLTYGNILDATIKYSATNKVVEYYYIDNHIVTSGELPLIINLYDLNTSDSTSYLNTYKDCSYLNIGDAIIETWRKYVSEGQFYLVEMSKTNEVGQTVSHLVSEDIVYKYYVRKDGVLQYITPEFNALCISTPCQINIVQKGEYCDTGSFEGYQSDPDITYILNYNETTRYITFEFSTNDGTPATLNLLVTKFDSYFNTTACSETITSAGGTLSCYMATTLTNSTYYIEITKNGNFVTSAFMNLNTDAQDIFGLDGVLYTFLIILTLSLAFIPTGWGVLIVMVLGFVVSGLLSFISWNYTLLIWLCLACIIIILKISKKVDSG